MSGEWTGFKTVRLAISLLESFLLFAENTCCPQTYVFSSLECGFCVTDPEVLSMSPCLIELGFYINVLAVQV